MNFDNIVLVLSSGVVIKLLDIVYDYYKTKKNPLYEAVCALLRDRILHLCEKFIAQGWVSHKQYESLCMLYHCYKALGGNGFIDDEMELVKELERR